MIFNIKKKNLVNNILKSKLKSKSILNILILFSGTLIAIVIPVLVLPVLTRLWSPNDFGIFATYLAFVGVLSVLSAGSLNVALILVKKNKDAIKERNANYKKNTNYKYDPAPEKKKEYARRAYLKRKEKLQKDLEEKQNDENI